jgi:hypothetical protein
LPDDGDKDDNACLHSHDPLALLEALILASRIRSHFSPPPAKIATLGYVSRDTKP